MTTLPTRMKHRQLVGVVKQFAEHFPGWKIIHGNQAIVRELFPIRQQISFEALRSGAYRPSHVMASLPVPLCSMLFQFLSIPGRELQYKWHNNHWKEMLDRMDQQFVPSVRRPLDILEVTALCEWEARPTVNDGMMLATLYAWLGRSSQAIDKCREMQSYPPPALAPRIDWDQRMQAFARDLVTAIERGVEREFLERSAEEAAKG